MEALLAAPVIIKVLASLIVILVLNRFCRHLAVPLTCAAALLALWSGHSPGAGLAIAWRRLSSTNDLFLLAIIFQVVWLSSQMAEAGGQNESFKPLYRR